MTEVPGFTDYGTANRLQDHIDTCGRWQTTLRWLLGGAAAIILSAGSFGLGQMLAIHDAIKELQASDSVMLAAITQKSSDNTREIASLRDEFAGRVRIITEAQIARANSTQLDVDRLSQLVQRQLAEINTSLQAITTTIHKIELEQVATKRGK